MLKIRDSENFGSFYYYVKKRFSGHFLVLCIVTRYYQLTYWPGGALPIMDYTGRLRPKGVLFSSWRYVKG